MKKITIIILSINLIAGNACSKERSEDGIIKKNEQTLNETEPFLQRFAKKGNQDIDETNTSNPFEIEWTTDKPKLYLIKSNNDIFVNLVNESDGLMKLHWFKETIANKGNFQCTLKNNEGVKVKSLGIKPYASYGKSGNIIVLMPKDLIGYKDNILRYSFLYDLKKGAKYTLQCSYFNNKNLGIGTFLGAVHSNYLIIHGQK